MALIVLLLAGLVVGLAYRAVAAVSVSVPYSSSAVNASDLDGDPLTGAWSAAASYLVPLENGETGVYGTVTLYTMHDGTYLYVRIDGKIDVAWASASGNHFWLGWVISQSTVTGHHKLGQDFIFFGDTSYTGISYPLSPVDAYGSAKPPARDAQQDAVGRLKYSGSLPPYSFTAEWRRALDTGDSQDVRLVPDGSTTYNLYLTTDSNGKGSSGGNIDHSQVTNPNTIRIQPVPPGIRDVAVTSTTLSAVSATIGDILTITITVVNQGTSDETARVRASYDNMEIGTVSGLIPKGQASDFSIAWDTTSVPEGTHTITSNVDPVPNESDTADNSLQDGQVIISPPGAIHDIAVVAATPSALNAVAGEVLTISVIVANQGTVDEVATVRAFHHSTEIEIASASVAKDSSATFEIAWNTAGIDPGIHPIEASADQVAGESDISDNNLSAGEVTIFASPDQQTTGENDGQSSWLMSLVALLSATVSLIAMSFLYVSSRVKHHG